MEPLDTVTSFLDRVRRWGPEFTWVATGQALAFLGALVSIKVLTAALGPVAYGELALGLTIAGALHMFVYGPIEQTVLRFASVYQARGSLGSFGAQVASFNRIIGGWVLGAACLAGLVVWVAAGTQWALLVVAGIVYSIVVGAGASLNSLLTGLRERRIVALYQGLEPWMRLLAALVAVVLIYSAGHVAMLGFITGTLLAVVIESLYTRKTRPGLRLDVGKTATGESTDFREQFLRYGTPFMLFAAFAAVSTYADRWIILGFISQEGVGIYAAIYQIANAPSVLVGATLNQLVIPIVFQHASRPNAQDRSASIQEPLFKIVKLYVLATMVAVPLCFVFGKEIVGVLTSQEFSEFGDLLWILMLGSMIFQTTQVLTVSGFSSLRTRVYVLPRAIQTLTFLGAALIFVKYGLVGVAWALVISSIAYLVAVLAVNRRL